MDTNGNKIIAVDFDKTLSMAKWPDVGEPNELLFRYLIEKKAAGARIILWSCREGEDLERAVEFCKENGLTFDCVNKNLPDLIELYGNDCRKINADIYIDDKAFNVKDVNSTLDYMKIVEDYISKAVEKVAAGE